MDYYNEIDPIAAQWVRNLIDAGHLAPGIVDERSIEDVKPNDLRGFTQCHFFAGVGVWSYALRKAGFPSDRPVWTGSCPCQPFSAAGKGAGFDDERHLWPAWHYLIGECKPECVIGEQVASKDADPWIDLVQTDMEALGYAFGAVPFPSASVGAPHIRDRLYWVANTPDSGLQRWGSGEARNGRDTSRQQSERLCNAGGLEYAGQNHDAGQGSAASNRQQEADRPTNITCGSSISLGGMADTGDSTRQRSESRPTVRGLPEATGEDAALWTGPTNGFWRDADWLGCRDGKLRPVEPGTFPLAHGAAARVGRLRAYGNAINAVQAQIFIEIVMESIC